MGKEKKINKYNEMKNVYKWLYFNFETSQMECVYEALYIRNIYIHQYILPYFLW